MGSSLILINDKIKKLVPNGHKEIIGKIIENFISDTYISDSPHYRLMEELNSWKYEWITISLNTLSKKDFNEVVKALEKGRKYLDTLMTEEAREEFVEDYIGISVFNDLKYYVDETIRHCYQDPRYEAKTD